MLSPFQWLQVVFALVVLAVIVERSMMLWWRLPLSDAASRWLTERIRAGDLASAQRFAAQRPDTLIGCLVLTGAAAAPGEAIEEIAASLADQSHRATQRLLALRVFATLGSTLGLLGAVLALRRGLGGGGGLVALEAGLAERMAVGEALLTMAMGVATAAVAFYALAALRRAARGVIAQGRSIAHLLEQHASGSSAAGPRAR